MNGESISSDSGSDFGIKTVVANWQRVVFSGVHIERQIENGVLYGDIFYIMVFYSQTKAIELNKQHPNLLTWFNLNHG